MRFWIVALAALLLGCMPDPIDGEDWIRESGLALWEKSTVVPRARFREVDAPPRADALSVLTSKASLALSDSEVKRYLNDQFDCPAPSAPFLVRAVVANRSTGGFEVREVNSVLIVVHASLGAGNPKLTKSALIVCANGVDDVFVQIRVAR